MAKWTVIFTCETDKVDEQNIYTQDVDCHWGYNAPKVAIKQMSEEEVADVHKNLVLVVTNKH
jgi:hypothetical protein